MFFNLLFLILGLVFGSFIAAFSWRYPKGKSIIYGRSFCPKCKKTIRWFDNLPIISFIILRGKCRECKKPISWRYFLIEFISGLGFLFIYTNYGYDLLLTFYLLVIFLILILIFVVDLENKIIPDPFIFTGIAISFLTFIFIDSHTLLLRFFAGFLTALILLSIHLLTKGRGMGLGDVKFAVLGGLFIGFKMCLVWLLVAFLTGGLVGIILILLKRAGLKDEIPFGPFLVISLCLTFVFGDIFLKILGF